MKLFKRKKKIYDFGDFQSDDKNDYGIAKFYYNRCIELEKQNYKQFQEICKLKRELQLHGSKRYITELEIRDI